MKKMIFFNWCSLACAAVFSFLNILNSATFVDLSSHQSKAAPSIFSADAVTGGYRAARRLSADSTAPSGALVRFPAIPWIFWQKLPQSP